MRLYALFAMRKSSVDDDLLPECLVCWDEFCVEENPDGFDTDCEKAKKSLGDELAFARVVELSVPDSELRKLFGPASIAAKVAG